MSEEIPIVVQVEGIKLMKMSKGYNWEIKTIGLDIDKLEKLNQEMSMRFGGLGKNED